MRRRMMMNVDLLPSGYRQLEYIENISNAYIDTGVTANDANIYLWDGKIGMAQTAANRRFLAGFNNLGDPTYCEISVDNKYGATNFNRPYFCDTILTTNRLYSVSLQLSYGRSIYSLTEGGHQQSVTYTGTSRLRNNFYLFPAIIAGMTLGIFIGRNRLFVNGDVVRDYVPAQRLSDNKVGMYDLVTNQFYVSPNGVDFSGAPYNEYTQRGLIMWLDGIDNAGIGVHETNPTTWLDLTGNHTIVAYEDGTIPTFSENAARFNLTNAIKTNSPLSIAAINNNQCTIEMVCLPVASGVNTNNLFINLGQSVRGFSIWDNANHTVSGYSYRQDGYGSVNTYDQWNKPFRIILQGNKIYIKYGTTTKLYTDTNTGVVTDDLVVIGTGVNAYIHAIRVYNRVLTDAEIYNNARLDEQRFNLTLPI